ncbi:MAG: bacterioferritin [Bdellovibrionaceae bacterium]|nr:bacterioferritin [Pseudobdellovibrionaceae bacterium]
MKGDKRVLEALNGILTNELTAINQYFLHARICKDWGYAKLADKVYHESIDEMKHAQELIDRILFLEGLPNLQKLHPLNIGQTLLEQLKADLALENKAIPDLKEAIEVCLEVKDHGTREVLEHILVSEEEHVDWLETQLKLIEDLGLENYLSQQVNA